MPKYPPKTDNHSHSKKPYSQPSGRRPLPTQSSAVQTSDRPQRRGPKPPPSAPVISKSHKDQQAQNQPQSLDLTGKSLTEPPNLAKEYPRLGKLNLTDCGLTSITFVSQVRNTLTWLNLSGNKLMDSSAWEGIEQLKSLYVLNASHCELAQVPGCVSSLESLKALVLSHNSLKSLEHIRNLPDLNTIVVSNNQLTSLPSTLTSLPSLKKISASHNLLTSPGLPNLSSLSHLHELRFSNNPTLTSLPSHFGQWGKQPLPPTESNDEERGGRRNGGAKQKAKQGIEILDLTACGFENWFGLKAIAQQDGIVNLGLKGNKVAEDAMTSGGGFEEFKSKLTILLPSLRILDSIRFDAKHFELKTLRASRTPEQALLDAGPMALDILAKKSAAEKERIELEKVKEILKEREREKENKRRRRKGLEELGDGTRRKEREDRLKREREAAGEGEEKEDGSEKEEEVSEEPPKKKSKKDKSTSLSKAKKESVPKATPVVPELTADSDAQTKSARKREKKSKSKREGGVLDALRANPDDPLIAVAAKKKPEPAPAQVEEKKEEPKQKTSVLRVVEVKKKDKKSKNKDREGGAEGNEDGKAVDVGDLLGLGKKSDEEKKGGVFDALGSGSGAGMFGGGGWD